MHRVRCAGLIALCCAFPALAAPKDKPEAPPPVVVLTTIMAQVLTCSDHPCIDDNEKRVRADVREIVTDGIFYYSDLGVAYPVARGVLTGIVEWDFEKDPLALISLKITGFRASRQTLLQRLEKKLNCVLEQDDEAGNEWSCLPTDRNGHEVLFEAYFGPGLVILELSH